jgi:hypothetical protein
MRTIMLSVQASSALAEAEGVIVGSHYSVLENVEPDFRKRSGLHLHHVHLIEGE